VSCAKVFVPLSEDHDFLDVPIYADETLVQSDKTVVLAPDRVRDRLQPGSPKNVILAKAGIQRVEAFLRVPAQTYGAREAGCRINPARQIIIICVSIIPSERYFEKQYKQRKVFG
jgi:hypothetical protein